ncbi:protein retinal degeneration B-like isoform X2 [Daphnia pulex]|uniref:protein retinal degeneration B-like isoform X2 n=1 Tax=Daphnia pulex TaxID=6669 RepID=UPI001EDF0016|nr:protein retinal degeneration B-like isoform X2 [Daphnia pulex]XP_046450432.1 protein retinal degeneration B-like isoform X2 [Daphnia pulex]
MLIKEYRIPLPLTVEEYRIAQLYMIAKKSREESCGEGSGVEILVNEPYTEGPGGSGQYTHKIFHVGSHLPGWLKALLPKSAFIVEEKAWNAYPYTRTRYTCPFIEKFSLDIETVYREDCGDIENVFKLSKSELNDRAVDLIDVVKDQLPTASDYVKEEDPCVYISRKTGRGPLSDSWIQDYWRECKGQTLPLSNGKAIMCAYKLCRVEFKYWGMQAKIERFIHDIALRKTMVRAHRQAWTWQDEWFNLTMDDIRELERQTQEALAKKMASATTTTSEGGLEQQQLQQEAKTSGGVIPSSLVPASPEIGGQETVDSKGQPVAAASVQGAPSWPMSCISESSSEDDEFFDCQDFRSAQAGGALSPTMVRWSSMELVPQGEEADELDPAEKVPDERIEERDSIFSAGYLQRFGANQRRPSRKLVSSFLRASGSGRSQSPGSTGGSNTSSLQSHPASALILVFHGGTVLDVSSELANKAADLATFRSNLEAVIRQHFPSLCSGRLAVRLVSCPTLCPDAITVLNSLSCSSSALVDPVASPPPPTSADSSHPATSDSSAGDPVAPPPPATSAAPAATACWPPLGCLPLFAASSPEYADTVTRTIVAANLAYSEFLKSPEGGGFSGAVAVVADSAGSVLLYDALCKSSDHMDGPGGDIQSHFGGSDNSIAEEPDQHSPGGVFEEEKKERDHFAPSGASSSFKSPRSYHHLQAPTNRRHSTSASEHGPTRHSSSSAAIIKNSYLDFEVGDCFLLGSPLSLVLAFRKWSHNHHGERWPRRPHCHGIFNLFHSMDPLAARLEPLLSARFANTRPVSVPRYQRYPLGDGKSNTLVDFVQNNPQLFQEPTSTPPQPKAEDNNGLSKRRQSDGSFFHGSDNSLGSDPLAAQMASLSQRWWGSKRLDYVFYCPDGLTSFPPSALPHLLHASFWESADVAAFILRQLMRLDVSGGGGVGSSAGSVDEYYGDIRDSNGGSLPFSPGTPCEKWMRKRTSVKIKNIGANHRANDIIVNETMPQVIVARFMYGPLDMVALTGEKVDVHFLRDANNGEWDLIATEVTDKAGRLVCTLPPDRTLPPGLHPIKMVVRGDHTYADLYVAVLPARTQAVVFSIDGSFTASVSVTGRDPKVRAGAVDVVRHWQELGYLIIYTTGRPDMQQRRVVSWLAQHNFPHGLLSFADGLSTDPLRHKADYLKLLVNDVGLEIRAAYGSSKDISVYASVGIKPENIYIVGKVSRKHQGQAQSLIEGYASHLSNLALHQCRPAQINPYLLLPRGCLSLPGHGAPLLRRRQDPI